MDRSYSLRSAALTPRFPRVVCPPDRFRRLLRCLGFGARLICCSAVTMLGPRRALGAVGRGDDAGHPETAHKLQAAGRLLMANRHTGERVELVVRGVAQEG